MLSFAVSVKMGSQDSDEGISRPKVLEILRENRADFRHFRRKWYRVVQRLRGRCEGAAGAGFQVELECGGVVLISEGIRLSAVPMSSGNLFNNGSGFQGDRIGT